MEELKKHIINELEKKQSEISTEVDEIIANEVEIAFQNEQFAEGYEQGVYQGIETAILIVQETIDFFKGFNNKGE